MIKRATKLDGAVNSEFLQEIEELTKAQVKLHEVLNKNIELERQNQSFAEEIMEATGHKPKGLNESSASSDSLMMAVNSTRERSSTLHVA